MLGCMHVMVMECCMTPDAVSSLAPVCIHAVLQEEADLQAAIDSQASNPQQCELEAELLQQLQCHLASLRKQQQQLTARSDSVS
jgi:hypothetical protein